MGWRAGKGWRGGRMGWLLLTLSLPPVLPLLPVLPPLAEQSFTLDRPAEVVATLHAGCERSDWGVAGREGAAVTVAVDGSYRAHVMLTRGEQESEYRIL